MNYEFLCCGIVGRVTLGQIELEAEETKEKVEKSILAENCGNIRPSSVAESNIGEYSYTRRRGWYLHQCYSITICHLDGEY